MQIIQFIDTTFPDMINDCQCRSKLDNWGGGGGGGGLIFIYIRVLRY